MSSPAETNTEKQAAESLHCEALLQAEIGFWQELIATCPATQPGESLERMRHALALAESKLAMLSGFAGAARFQMVRKQ
jgi:hypothetical protein